jgi:HlyD family secretion protein
MNPRLGAFRHGVRVLLAAGAVALGLSLQGLFAVPAQEATRPSKGADSPEKPTLKARLRAQQLATRKARVTYEIARLNRELAEIALEEYAEDRYTLDMATAEGEVKLAEADRTRSEDRVEWARRMHKKGFVSKATLVSEELNFEKAKFALEQANANKSALAQYTGPRRIKALQVDVDKAHKDELDKKAAWKREEAKEADLEREIGRK